MKASELRIGNLIMFRNFIEPQEIHKVDSKVLMKAPGDYGDFEFNEYWQPIELTEEWLVKFGFEKDGSFTLNKLKLINCNNNYFIPFFNHSKSLNDVKYVHQLQNLYFALTGEELTL